ncbi:hypothetical protein ACWEBX_36590, partial [Streptomyces sp. NPDC005070]
KAGPHYQAPLTISLFTGTQVFLGEGRSTLPAGRITADASRLEPMRAGSAGDQSSVTPPEPKSLYEITSSSNLLPARALKCRAATTGTRCHVAEVTPSQLWWTARQAIETPDRKPAQTDDLRRWAIILIDGLLDFRKT